MPRIGPSIQVYVVLCILASIAVAVGGFGLWAPARISDFLISTTAARLRSEIVRDSSAVPNVSIGQPHLETANASDELHRISGTLTHAFEGRDARVAIYGASGIVLEESDSRDLPSIPRLSLGEIEDGIAGRLLQTVKQTDHGRLLLSMAPIGSPAGPAGLAVVGVALNDIDESVALFRGALALAGVLAAIAGGTLGVVGTAILLRPLDKISATAKKFGPDRLGVRSGLTKAPGEISALSASFDAMLDRVQTGFDRQRRFVADTTHELRTPLTTIGGAIEIALAGGAMVSPATSERLLRNAQSEVERMNRLITELLLLSREESGLPNASVPIDLGAIARDIAEGSPAGSIRLENESEEAVVVLGQDDRVRQIALILLDNARLYSPAGADVTLTVRRAEEWGELSVTDRGIGMDGATLAHVFERFYRSEHARTRAAGGSGLGLAIARSLAIAMDGEIEASSPGPGLGSTFTLRLPFAEIQTEKDKAA